MGAVEERYPLGLVPWKHPELEGLPGYAEARAELLSIAEAGDDVRDAWMRVENGRVAGIGGVKIGRRP